MLQSDLIKNMVLYEAEKKGIAGDDATRLWSFQSDWWRQEIRQGRLVRPRIDVFLNYWMVMRTSEDITTDHVFSEFRRYYRENKSIRDITYDMSKVGESYRALEEAYIPHMATFLYRWKVMQVGVLTPVLLWLLSSEVSQKQLERGLRALESHQVRRMVCRMSTMGHNRLFNSLVERIEKAGPEYAGDTVLEFLRNQESNVGLWPDDRQLEGAFMNLPLYRLLTRGRLRMVFEGIEDELRTAKAECQSTPRNLTIEHIMPQTWRPHWPLAAGLEDKADAAHHRDQVIHSIGNLTLVNDKLGPALSHSSWEKKRPEFHKHSVLYLNKELLDTAPEVWDEATIEKRARELCRVATRVWPYADQI